jgi:hypothetical protein
MVAVDVGKGSGPRSSDPRRSRLNNNDPLSTLETTP